MWNEEELGEGCQLLFCILEIFHIKTLDYREAWAHVPPKQLLAGAESQLPLSDAAQSFQLIPAHNYLLSLPFPAQPSSPIVSGI